MSSIKRQYEHIKNTSSGVAVYGEKPTGNLVITAQENSLNEMVIGENAYAITPPEIKRLQNDLRKWRTKEAL